MEAEFLVDGAVAKCGVRSETMKSLDVAMHYNYSLWLNHYFLHLRQIETMHNIGDVTMLSGGEIDQLVPEASAYSAGRMETGDLAPQDLIEDPIMTRLAT